MTRSIRNQLVRGVLDRVNFELPESAVAQETRNVVYDIVQENAKRGHDARDKSNSHAGDCSAVH